MIGLYENTRFKQIALKPTFKQKDLVRFILQINPLIHDSMYEIFAVSSTYNFNQFLSPLILRGEVY